MEIGSHYRALMAAGARARAPFRVLIELTHRCNLRCQHCYLDLLHPPEELSASEWKRVIDDMAASGTMFVTFSGGELFLRRDWLEIARHARARGLAVRLFTSGTRLTRADADAIAELRP